MCVLVSVRVGVRERMYAKRERELSSLHEREVIVYIRGSRPCVYEREKM